ncbi:MAG: hypothetical protein ACO1PB_17755 [Ramlibacter sp.]
MITLFIAALGWTGLRTSDRLTSSPFVEYELSERTVSVRPAQPSTTTKRAALRIRNITHDHAFGCFKIDFVGSRKGAKLGHSDDQDQIYVGNVGATASVVISQPMLWQWEIKDFLPRADLVLLVPFDGTDLPRLLVRPCESRVPGAPGSYGGSPGGALAPALLPRSVLTRYVEHELMVLWTALGLWLLALVWMTSQKQPEQKSARRIAPGARRRIE